MASNPDARGGRSRLAKGPVKDFDNRVTVLGDSLLNVADLAVTFDSQEGAVHAVDGVSFAIEPGETVGLVGESGCGKSISALAILGLVRMMTNSTISGRVEFMGRDLLALPEHEVRSVRGRDMAMIFQDPVTSLNPVLSIERQMTEGIENHLGCRHTDAVKRSIELLETVGIPKAVERLRDYPHQFSGGMRQRVMIAIALSCNPKLLLADEPTTALDVTIQAQILHLMRQLSRDYGAAIMLITHDLGVVAGMTERILVMYAGRIVESGTAKELFGHPHHPYTVGLLRSVPRLDEPRSATLQSIEGLPPDLAHLPRGCAFAPRCTLRTRDCGLERPELVADHAGPSVGLLPRRSARRHGGRLRWPPWPTARPSRPAPGTARRSSTSPISRSTSRSPRASSCSAGSARCARSTGSTSRSGAARLSAWSASRAAASRPRGAPSCSSRG